MENFNNFFESWAIGTAIFGAIFIPIACIALVILLINFSRFQKKINKPYKGTYWFVTLLMLIGFIAPFILLSIVGII